MTGAVIYTIESGWVPPVDYVMEVYGDASPAELYDGTIWARLKDSIIMSAGDDFAVGTTGGSTTVTLTTGHLPEHVHTGTTSSDGAHTHTFNATLNVSWKATGREYRNDDYGYLAKQTTNTTSSAGAHTHTVTVGGAGGGKAFSLMNPYMAVNFWQRIG